MTILNFNIEKFEVDDNQSDDSQFLTARILLFSSGSNLHEMTCSPEILRKTAKTIYNKPILYSINKYLDDFFSHSDPDKTLISGFIVPNSEEFVELDSNRLGMYVTGKVWKKYAPKFVEILKRDDGKKKNSVEMKLIDSEELPDGTINMLDWEYFGTCVLGDNVREASPGSHLQVLSFAKDNEEYIRDYNLEFGSYESLDFTIPKSVGDNAKKGLELHKKNNLSSDSVSLSIGRHLANSEKSNPEKIKHIAKVFGGHRFDNRDKKNINSSYAKHLMYGGNEGMNWANELNDKISEQDNKHLSYFGTELTFPYTATKDANPALRGVEPPLSLGQMNEISRVADGIGADKNGWPIAIGNFKKSHKVVDGHWVKKDEKMDEEFAKEDLGKGESISVDKSKESVSNESWGSVDKTSLQHKILGASNYKSLVHDVYLLVLDGWEQDLSKLKYPVMQLKNGKFVYNSNALSSALGYAKKENETEVVSKVNGLQKKLGLGSEKEEDKNMSDVKDTEIKEEEMATEAPVKEEEMAKPDPDEVEKEKEEEKKEDSKEEKTEKPSEEKKEEKVEDKKEEKDEKMSNDSYIDAAAILAFLKNETEDNQEIVDEFAKPQEEVNYAKVCMALFAKACGMAKCMAEKDEQNKAYMAENDELKKFKADMEEKQKQFAIDSTFAKIELEADLPKEKKDELIAESKNFSLEGIDGWQNLVKAVAFDYKKGTSKKEDDGIVKMGLPWGIKTPDQKKSLWE